MCKRIIIVEDHPDTQRLYHRIFKELDAEITILPDGNDALTHMRHHKPDLLLLDINLPTINGLTVLKYARVKLGLTSDKTKILIVSGDWMATSSDLAKMADACIEKPFSTSLMVQVTKNLLNDIDKEAPK